jgi:hypothetical protein
MRLEQGSIQNPFFLAVLEFELKAGWQALYHLSHITYHLSHAPSPFGFKLFFG